jgi:hypothetical protein
VIGASRLADTDAVTLEIEDNRRRGEEFGGGGNGRRLCAVSSVSRTRLLIEVEPPQRADRKKLGVRGGAKVFEGVTDELVTVHGGSLGAPTVCVWTGQEPFDVLHAWNRQSNLAANDVKADRRYQRLVGIEVSVDDSRWLEAVAC